MLGHWNNSPRICMSLYWDTFILILELLKVFMRPNNHSTAYDIRCHKTIVNLVSVWYDELSPLESLCHPREALGWHNLSLGDKPSYHTLTRLMYVNNNKFVTNKAYKNENKILSFYKITILLANKIIKSSLSSLKTQNLLSCYLWGYP